MNWDQIREIHNFDQAEIGNHSHSHEYLVEEEPKEIIEDDIRRSIKIFKREIRKKIQSFFLILLVNIVLNLKKS